MGFLPIFSELFSKWFVEENPHTHIEVFRYLFVGSLAFVVDFSLLFILTHYVGIYYLISAAISFTLGLTTTYVFSVIWVFSRRKLKNRKVEFIVFSSVGVIGLGLNELIIWGFTESVGFHYLISKIVATIIVFVFNFSVRKVLLFNG